MSEKILFYGGNILTPAGEKAEALLVEDGRIAAVGTLQAAEQQAGNARRVDLQGNTLMPAFVDPHSHFTQMANAAMQVSLAGANSPAEMARRIGAYVKENRIPAGEWVTARDYDQTAQPGGENPALRVLDSFCPDNPLMIQYSSGHMGLFNSPALHRLGITARTQAPEGGSIGHDEQGQPNGYLEENAFFQYQKQMPMPGPEQFVRAFGAAQQNYFSHGITTFQEGMVVKEMLPLYGLLLRAGLLQGDVVAYPDRDTYGPMKKMLEESGSAHVRVGGIKIVLDGSPQGRTAWLRRPYEGEKEYCGYGTMTDEAVEEAFEMAARENTQLLAHCNGDRAVQQFLDCLERAEEKYPCLQKLRPVIIHGQLMGRDQMEQAARLGAVVSFFGAHVWHWGDVHLKNLGPERAGAISPAVSAQKAGVPFTLHQDAPVIQPDMWETIWCGVNRRTRNGVTLGPEERLTARQALEAVTKTAAWQYGEEKDKGTLETGKRADMIVVDRFPLTCPGEELRDVKILQTWKDGKLVWESRAAEN